MPDSYKYEQYISPYQPSRWATVEEIENSGKRIDLTADDYPAAGLPLLSDARTAYVDDSDTHTLIFGTTGSKKTRLFCMPMLNFFTNAGESFIVTDPKGELHAKTSGLARKKGYETIVLNFRDIGHGDMWNPLALPYALYHSGNKESAVALLNDFIATIAEPSMATTNDIFWTQMASSFALANLYLLMDAAKPEECHISSFAKLCSGECLEDLKKLSERLDGNSIAGMNYKAVFVNPEKTLSCIFSSLYAMVRVFITQKSLTSMLSGNTFDIRSFGRKKTAVYIMVPDEKTTYHFLVTTFIKQIYEILINEAQKESDFQLPVRVNFVLDEFCNIPKIPDMPSMITAARSRNMRFYLIAQSLQQLKSRYDDDADTLKGNCENWVFLTSKELGLLNEISELCGNIHMADKRERRLISVSELQRFDKSKGEVLIMHARQYPIVTEMPDIDEYEMFKGHDPVDITSFSLPKVVNFSVEKLVSDIKNKTAKVPFSGEKDDVPRSALRGELDKKFDELFGYGKNANKKN